jgi:hypothetical protein
LIEKIGCALPVVGVSAEEVAKPLVSLTVKTLLLSADRDIRGQRSEPKDKEMTLRVEIKNLSDTTLEDAELTGDVILNRSVNDDAKIVQEVLTTLKLPAIKPNEKITVDLGKFTISKVKWHCRSFDETLEEWKVVCNKGDANIGEKISTDKYGYLLRGIQNQKAE